MKKLPTRAVLDGEFEVLVVNTNPILRAVRIRVLDSDVAQRIVVEWVDANRISYPKKETSTRPLLRRFFLRV